MSLRKPSSVQEEPVKFLDTDQQEDIVGGLERDAKRTDARFSAIFCTLGLAGCLRLLYAIAHDIVSEDVSPLMFVHVASLITVCGACWRVWRPNSTNHPLACLLFGTVLSIGPLVYWFRPLLSGSLSDAGMLDVAVNIALGIFPMLFVLTGEYAARSMINMAAGIEGLRGAMYAYKNV
eukprot:TRINITY_DN68338_c0_g1_i1.p1 TRINITY_DN68338_c0_g1~~TRINITY_DN68338_c0_g1_i1.p1  ORF type:complete len:178 (+),score=11.34 TRINITY_DN68338_c0_g1_i1:132-665(+)